MLNLNFDDLALYLFVERKLDRSCTNDYKSRYGVVFRYFNDNFLDFTKPNVNKFFAYLEEKKLSNNSLNNYLKLLKHVAHYLQFDFLDSYAYYKKTKKYIEILTPIEIKKLAEVTLPYTKENKITNTRDKALIYTLSMTGMRINELCSLTWNDIKENFFYLSDTKTDVPRYVPIADMLWPYLNRIQKYPHNYIFGTYRGRLHDKKVNELLHERALKIGLKKPISAHLFRHSYVTTLLKNKQPINLVSRIVGHASVDTTMGYDHPEMAQFLNVANNHPLALEHIKFSEVKYRIKELAELLSITKYAISINEDSECIKLEIQHKKVLDNYFQ